MQLVWNQNVPQEEQKKYLQMEKQVVSSTIRKGVSFELGEEIEKEVISSYHELGTKKILSPHEELNFRPSDFWAPIHRATEKHIYETHPAYC